MKVYRQGASRHERRGIPASIGCTFGESALHPRTPSSFSTIIVGLLIFTAYTMLLRPYERVLTLTLGTHFDETGRCTEPESQPTFAQENIYPCQGAAKRADQS